MRETLMHMSIFLFNWLHKRIIELFGTLMIFSSFASIVATVSYCPEDPSFNNAIDGLPTNLLSYFGSHYSDIMVQLFGISAYVFSIILLSFGVQILKNYTVPFGKIVAGIFSCVMCSITTAVFFKNVAVTGIIGSCTIKMFTSNIDIYANSLHIIIGGILSIITFLLLIFSSNKLFERNNFASFDDALEIVKEKVTDIKIHAMHEKNSEDTSDISLNEEPGITSIEVNITSSQNVKKAPKKKIKNKKYAFPSNSLLKEATNNIEKLSESELKSRSLNLVNVLNDFGIKGEITGVSPGPVVTLYELKPAAGIKSSRVIGLSSDIARYMSAVSARVAIVPGKNALGIELPNAKRQTVFLREILESSVYTKTNCALPIALGKDISGAPIVVDLAKTPHLLIAGTTGSGKSVGINAMILSLLYKLSPEECKFIMIDPKMLELSVYDDIPHLLTPVVTDPKKAVIALKWAVKEMESRYMAMSKLGVRNITGYNSKINEIKQSGEELTRRVHTGFDPSTGSPIYENQSMDMEVLPYIVIIVDEMADLMLVAGKDIEIMVQRLAQMARAAGIHLIMATQRPSVDVITGTIKANFPSRVSFQVSSKIDSRTILGEQGAEQLLGQGDMLYMASVGKTIRVHCPFVSDNEVEKITNYIKEQGEPQYISTILEEDDILSFKEESSDGEDPLYNDALNLILREGKASTSFIQRHLKIGYNRAARIIDMLEAANIISSANHVGKREIIGR